MAITDFILRQYFKWRQRRIEKWINNPFVYQERILKRIINSNKDTFFGRDNDFENIANYDDYRLKVEPATYEQLYPYIKKMLDGDSNILCREKINWFAKSSGTSAGRSKYIPVSRRYLQKGHLKCAWDVASFIYNEDQSAQLFKDRSLIMGGSIEELDSGLLAGDISAIILHHFPRIGRRFYTPDLETALMKDWDAKIKKMATITKDQNLTLLAGVPTWIMVLLDEVLAQTGKKNISEVWPNLRSFLHGGVGFEPYRKAFGQYIPSDKLIYREAYNASEGYFAMQNEKGKEGMLLLCDHEIFYEFAPLNRVTTSINDAVTLRDVEKETDYVFIISNTSGLYRYVIGDIVRFVSIDPYKIIITGRLHQQLNVFGEELSIHNAETALAKVCERLDVQVTDFTVAPLFMNQNKSGAHEWLIEFENDFAKAEIFAAYLDEELRKINSDYDAKRSHDLVLKSLQLTIAPGGTFEKWLRKNTKFGGQHKVPRLQNTRKIMQEIKACMTDSPVVV